MKTKEAKPLPQPEPVTPGVTRSMVRDHAYRIYRDILQHRSLTLQDWVLAEKDLVKTLQTESV
jgi:hypothetical protein